MKIITTTFIVAALAQYFAIEQLASLENDTIRISGFIASILLSVLLFIYIAVRLLTTSREPRTWHDREHITPARRRPLESGDFPNLITRD